MNASSLADDSLQSSVTTASSSQAPPSQPMLTSSSPANQQAPTTASATNHLTAQYSQFLASVRDFKPLVADLNTSIASVATSVTTMGADVSSRCVPEGPVTGSEHYVSGGMILHSPMSQPVHREPSQSNHHSQIVHNDAVSQHQGIIETCVLSVVGAVLILLTFFFFFLCRELLPSTLSPLIGSMHNPTSPNGLKSLRGFSKLQKSTSVNLIAEVWGT